MRKNATENCHSLSGNRSKKRKKKNDKFIGDKHCGRSSVHRDRESNAYEWKLILIQIEIDCLRVCWCTQISDRTWSVFEMILKLWVHLRLVFAETVLEFHDRHGHFSLKDNRQFNSVALCGSLKWIADCGTPETFQLHFTGAQQAPKIIHNSKPRFTFYFLLRWSFIPKTETFQMMARLKSSRIHLMGSIMFEWCLGTIKDFFFVGARKSSSPDNLSLRERSKWKMEMKCDIPNRCLMVKVVQ